MTEGGVFTSGLRKLHGGGDDCIETHGNGKKVGTGTVWVLKASCGLEFFLGRNGLNTKVFSAVIFFLFANFKGCSCYFY